VSNVPDVVEKRIRAWLETFVVGLKLCPFAGPYVQRNNALASRLRISICREIEAEALHRAFLQELDCLQSCSEQSVATTLLVFPNALQSFDEYLDFLDDAQSVLEPAGLEGLVQLASFHPQYQFEGEPEGAASHYSNRAPYPLIHLLREDMLERVLLEFPNPEGIPGENIKTLEELGVSELKVRYRALFGE
jgi:hypothetical protein